MQGIRTTSLDSIYYYIQRYALKDGGKIKRKGFISLVRLAELGAGIHAHEQTLSGPKADRLRLMQACNANLSPIFSLYSDPRLAVNRLLDAAADKGRPVVDVEDDNGVENIIWRVDDADIIREVSALMAGKALFIADGHHRYETALNYRNLMREKNPHPTGLEPYNYVMMYFSNMDSEGMTIWPTHRVIHGLAGFDGDNLLKECARYFDMQEFRFAGADEPRAREAFLKGMEEAGRRTTAIGLHIRARNAYHVMTLKEKETGNLGAGIPEVFKSLDVTVLHSLILSKILGITKEAQEKQTNIIYVKSHEEALTPASSMRGQAPAAHPEAQAVFLLNPTRIEQVKAVAEAGLVMPQKSTYFYPKLLSGLVINLMNEKIAAASVKARPRKPKAGV
ncbi:MAG: DUF1015 domain-containing protein [Deltaproteobacteria bacterium]|nr:DUF1015 domain-containing protein [Deltaproteobacteria bacterium]